MIPAPTIDFVIAGFLAGAAGGGAWDVELRSNTNALLGTVRLTAQDSALGLKSTTIQWPASATELATLNLVKYGSPLNPGGTLNLNKAYLRLNQTGTILATRGRVPLVAAQPVAGTSWTDVTDPILYQHSTQGFEPAPTVTLRVGGTGVGYPLTSYVRLVETSSGQPVGSEIEFFATNYSSPRSAAIPWQSLENGKSYHLQAKSSQPNWKILSADLEFNQSTIDPLGLESVVGWYAATTTPTNLVAGQSTGHLFTPVVNDSELTKVSWITVVKRVNGVGTVGANLVNSTGATVVSGSTSSSGTYVVQVAATSALNLSGAWWDTKAVLNQGAAGRLAGSVLRIRLRLRGTIQSLEADPSAISPNGDGVKDFTQITGGIHPDAENPTWDLTIRDATNAPVLQITGTGNNVAETWYGTEGNDPAGVVLEDAAYTATLSLPNTSAVLRQVVIVLDTTPPKTDALGPRFVDTPTMGISWWADDLSGVETFDVEVRDGNGSWTSWLSAVASGGATYQGEYDHVYFFQVRALDVAGNLGTFPGANGHGAVVVGQDPQGSVPLPEGIDVFGDGHCTGQVIRVRLGQGAAEGRQIDYSVESPDGGVHCDVIIQAPAEFTATEPPELNPSGGGGSDHEGEDLCGPGGSEQPGAAQYDYVSATQTIQDAPTIDVARLALHYRWYWDGDTAFGHSAPSNRGWCQLYTYAAGFPASGLWTVKEGSPQLVHYEWHGCPYLYCLKAWARGSAYYHTDFVHCNITTDWQEAWMQNNVFGYHDGKITNNGDPQTVFYNSFPCWGLHSSTYYKKHHDLWKEEFVDS